ncbi:MAG: MerC domain-containing protein [Planctomycetota bacterium]
MNFASVAWATLVDRVGIAASVGCAIHCMVAPLVLVVAPLLGAWWVDPVTHLTIAAVVIPLAAIGLGVGVRRHGKRWVGIAGLLGATLVLVGALAPVMGSAAEARSTEPAPTEHCGECCPTVTVDADTGEWSWRVPMASVFTLLGGAALVAAHLGNLRCCTTPSAVGD